MKRLILVSLLLISSFAFGQSVQLGGAVQVGSAGGGGVSSSSNEILSPGKTQGTIASTHGEAVSVGGSATQTLLNYSGGDGYVSELLIAINGDSNARANSLIKVYYNGSATADINTTVEKMFGGVYISTNGFGHSYSSQLFEVTGTGTITGNIGYVMYLPIPFTGGIKIDVVNGSGSSMTLWYTVKYHTGVTNNWPYEHKLLVGTYASGSTGCTPNSTLTLHDASTIGVKGKLVGIWLLGDGFPNSVSNPLAPLEGDMAIYLDGSGSPSYQSSGTEDWAGFPFYANGFQADNANGGNFHGTTFWSNSGSTGMTWSFYRYHIMDPIVFNTGLKVTWQCGDTSQAGFTGNPVVWGTVWYYTE